MLTELARQAGLALHNVQLDSALQATLDEVRRPTSELRASRARIVATADAERRKIERNLHDGAQQHLVALAVNLRLAQGHPRRGPRRDSGDARAAGGGREGDHRRAAQPRPRHLPAAARGRRARRGAAGRRRAQPARRRRWSPTGPAATRPRSRRRSTSAASRRCRTRPSTPRTRRSTVTGVARRTAGLRLRGAPTTDPASTSSTATERPRLHEHERPPGRHRWHRPVGARRPARAPASAGSVPLPAEG